MCLRSDNILGAIISGFEINVGKREIYTVVNELYISEARFSYNKVS